MVRKGLSTALVLIVTIVVLLIVALVILTIFGGAVSPVAGLGEGKSMCLMLNSAICAGAPTNGNCPAVIFSVYNTETKQTVACSTLIECNDVDGVCTPSAKQ